MQFLRIRGAGWGDPIADEENIEGTLQTILRRLDDKLKAHLSIAVDITSEATEQRTSPYPMAALQQLVRNAVMHRTYERTNAPIRLYWFDDRIEIHSPGGPFGIVTAENFGRPGITDYRNPHVAEAMKVLGYVQRFGVGIATAHAFLPKIRTHRLSLPSSPTPFSSLSGPGYEHSGSYVLQQQGWRRKDLAGLSHGVDVFRNGEACRGDRSRSSG